MKTPIILGASLLLAGCGIPEAMTASAQADSAASIAQANSATAIANAQSAADIANSYATLASNAMWATLLPGILLLVIAGTIIALGIWGATSIANHMIRTQDERSRRELDARMRAYEIELIMCERRQIAQRQHPATFHNQARLMQQAAPSPHAITITQRPRRNQNQNQYQ